MTMISYILHFFHWLRDIAQPVLGPIREVGYTPLTVVPILLFLADQHIKFELIKAKGPGVPPRIQLKKIEKLTKYGFWVSAVIALLSLVTGGALKPGKDSIDQKQLNSVLLSIQKTQDRILEKLDGITNVVKPTTTPPTPVLTEWKLVWYNHFEPNVLYEVDASKVRNGSTVVRNDEFRRWCEPFIPEKHKILNRYLVAADEEFKEVPGKGRENWWTTEAYGKLASLNQSWLHIMDDERWYVYEVVKTNP